MFSQASIILFTGGVYDANSCLRSHGLSQGSVVHPMACPVGCVYPRECDIPWSILGGCECGLSWGREGVRQTPWK